MNRTQNLDSMGGRRTERAAAYGNNLTTTTSSLTPIYGCCGLFDMCSDQDLISLSLEGASKFLDWLGWTFTDVCVVKKNFIAWTRPEYYNGSATAGYLANACDDPNSVDYGTCDFTLTDFGRLRRAGPTRDITYNDVRYCEAQPRYRLDGTQIMDIREYDLRLTAEVQLQDLKSMVMDGNASSAGQFDGLKRLVKTGYTNSNGESCALMDSVIIDWKSHAIGDATAGPTWNGVAMSAGFDLIDVLTEIVRNIRTRISWSPSLASQNMSVGDMILVMPTFLIRCLLDAYTCWSVCPGAQYNEANLNTFEARTFRRSLDGGMFGSGRIYIDGVEIPLLAYDWGTIVNGAVGDIWLLTGSIGGVKVIQGQLLDMRGPAAADPNALFSYTDGGRFLVWSNGANTCLNVVSEMRPRILAWAPWAQARIQNVKCATAGAIMSPDPTSAYFPIGSTGFYSPSCDVGVTVTLPS